jgi:CBS domain-containing protein
MRAKDIMATKVITVTPGNSVKHATQIMLDQGISGLPVIDDRADLVGIMTEGDLLRRVELETGRFTASVQAASSTEERARAYVKSQSWNVGDVMNTSVVTVDEDAPIGRVAALMEEHGIKRVPVTRASLGNRGLRDRTRRRACRSGKRSRRGGRHRPLTCRSEGLRQRRRSGH